VVDVNGTPLFKTTVPFFTAANRIDNSVGPILAEFSSINSTYHALVFTGRKPMSHGIEFLLNYTRSRATDNGMPFAGLGQVGSQLEGQQILNPYDRTIAQSYSGSDVPNRFTASIIWAPSFGANSTGAVKMITNGWSLASTITATNGTRYSANVASSSIPCQTKGFVGKTSGTDICVGAAGADGGMMSSVLMNTSVPGQGAVSFLPRAAFRMPGYTDVDLRLAKEFKFSERYSFEMRGEAFNVFNSLFVLGVNLNGYNYVNPGGNNCSTALHPTNTCMVKQADFGTPTTTSGNLLGARQLQLGLRFNF
jgi:hypothetical protein